MTNERPVSCHYLHAYYDDDWHRCPPNGGPVRQYRFPNGLIREYCDDGAEQVRDDGSEIELVETTK